MKEISTKVNIYSQRLEKDIEYNIIFHKDYLKIIKPKTTRKMITPKITACANSTINSNLQWNHTSGNNDLSDMLFDESNYQIKREDLPEVFENIWKAWKREKLEKKDIDTKLNHFAECISDSSKKEFVINYSEADKSKILERIDIFMKTIEFRILHTFDGIESEAKEVSKQSFKNLSKGVYPDEDPSDAYVQSCGDGCRHYAIQNEMKQELLNHYSSVLFHLFEKDCTDMNISYNGNIKHEEIDLMGIDTKKDSNFNKINKELRLIANVVKHGKGTSYNRLYKIRPELFSNKSWIIGTSDIEILLEELQQYADAMKGFWEEFFEIKLSPR